MARFGRRKFLAAAAAGTTAGCSRALSPWRFFTPAEARTLEAICECIIPEDDDPGARRAEVIGYIDRQLSGKFRDQRAVYRAGIAAAGDFASLTPGWQLERMHHLERDPATRPFIDLVIAHAMQGFYGNPRHGGNRDFASWRMLRIPILPVRGRATEAAGEKG